MNLAARAAGVFVAPRATYADVSQHPRLVGAIVLVLLLLVGAQAAFLSTKVGKDALFDQQMTTMESFGITVTDEMYQTLERTLDRAPLIGAAGLAVSRVVGALAVSGLLLGLFTAILGGAGTYKQVLAVVVHSGFILAVQQIFVAPLNYARGELSGASTLGVFFPNLDETGFPGRLSWSIDLFLVWWLISLAIGIGVLYRKRTGPIATSFLSVYVAIAVIVSIVRSVTSGA